MKKTMMKKRAFSACTLGSILIGGCCSICPCSPSGEGAADYPAAPQEDFISMFDGETFLSWQGDVDRFKVEQRPYAGWYLPAPNTRFFYADGNAMVGRPAVDGKPIAITSRKDYANFVLRFLYAPSSNSLAQVSFVDAEGKGGFTLPLKDELPAKDRAAWNLVEVRLAGNHLVEMFNGFIVRDETLAPSQRPTTGHIRFGIQRGLVKFMTPRIRRVAADWRADGCPRLNQAPAGFTALFDGKSLTGWKGVTTEESFDRPWVRQAASPEKRKVLQAKADKLRDEHWHVRDGALFFDGKKGGYSLATAKDYKDFEMYADWRLLTLAGDSGFYPRGVCQVQIWDAHNMWHLGSGGLYNNAKNPRHAMEIADRQPGDWNRCYMKMVGDRLTVKMNGVTVVDDIPLENANAKRFPGPIPAIEQLELQCHGDPLEFRNIFIREL